jgi:hypothetical protein
MPRRGVWTVWQISRSGGQPCSRSTSPMTVPSSGRLNESAQSKAASEKRALFLAAAGSASDPDVVAREIVKAIQATRPKTRYAVGAHAKPLVLMSTFLPDRFNDWLMGAITKSLLKQRRKESATQAA